jgi:hypothetical protein
LVHFQISLSYNTDKQTCVQTDKNKLKPFRQLHRQTKIEETSETGPQIDKKVFRPDQRV